MGITRLSPEEYFRGRMERKRLFEPTTQLLQKPLETETQRRPLERFLGQENLPLGLIIFGTIAVIMVGGIILVALRR